ncbi:MAG: periplasmic heavy metal sensor [Pseudomonadota bacterium]
MTNARTIGILALTGILSFTFIASNAMAAPQDGQKGDKKGPRAERMKQCGPQDAFHEAFAELDDDKKALFFSIMEEHKMNMAPVRDQMWAKRAQLKAISDDTITDMKVLTQVTDDIIDLRQQMRDAAIALDARMAAEIGIETQFAMKALEGDRGQQGHKGPHGFHGQQGHKGPHGPKGQECGKGPHGHKDGKGPHGPKGQECGKGPHGEKGPKGPHGEKGDKGPRGPQGCPENCPQAAPAE